MNRNRGYAGLVSALAACGGALLGAATSAYEVGLPISDREFYLFVGAGVFLLAGAGLTIFDIKE